MGAIAEYRQPSDFDELVDAVRAFTLVDLRLELQADYRLREEKYPHHRFHIDACGATISVTDDDAQVNVLSDDEIELLDLVRDAGTRRRVVTAREAVSLIRTTAARAGKAVTNG